MKQEVIRELSTADIIERLEEERKHLARLRMNHAVSPLDNPHQISKKLNRLEIPWEKALTTSSFPFVTPPGRFRPYLKNEKTFHKLLSNDLLAEVIVESNK